MIVRPSTLARNAAAACVVIIVLSAAYLLFRYEALPDILPVHFGRLGFPNGWQYKTYARVLMPVFVQIALVVTFGAVATLLLSRPSGSRYPDAVDARPDHAAPDTQAARAAAEAIALLALVWVMFQAYVAVALVAMWARQRGDLGVGYTLVESAGFVATILVFARANARFGRPPPRPFVAEHWRLGQLYKNPADPALFVPTRDGRRWTLNFGRPVAAALMGILLAGGVIGPAAILRLLLR